MDMAIRSAVLCKCMYAIGVLCHILCSLFCLILSALYNGHGYVLCSANVFRIRRFELSFCVYW